MNSEYIVGYNCSNEAFDFSNSFSVFVSGCNFRCPYCMNSKLIKLDVPIPKKILSKLKNDVEKFKPEIIFISGGEPTINTTNLFNIISMFRSWGCKIGLSTNGTNPLYFADISLKHIDYISMDLKGNMAVYGKIKDITDYALVLSSWYHLRSSKKSYNNFDYEIRTTLYPPFIDVSAIEELSKLFEPQEKWVLQQFRVTKSMPCEDAKDVKPYAKKELDMILEVARKRIPNTSLRYV